MWQYTLRRLLLFIPTLIGVSIFVFLMMRVIPADYVDVMEFSVERNYATVAAREEVLQRLRKEVGLDRPIYVQYLKWVSGLVRGNLGYSHIKLRPVSDIFLERIGPTLQLALMAIVLLYLWALPLGIMSSLKPNSVLDHTSRIVAALGLSLPNFWIGILIIYALLKLTGSVPSVVYHSPWDDPFGNLYKMIWPALTLAFHSGAGVMRLTRAQMLEVIKEDYIRTAYAKGLASRVVIIRHAMRNALIPVFTLSGIQLGHLIAGTVVIEFLFVIPGIGTGLLSAIGLRDYEVVGWFVLFISLVFLIITLIIDLLYAVIDPRIRYT